MKTTNVVKLITKKAKKEIWQGTGWEDLDALFVKLRLHFSDAYEAGETAITVDELEPILRKFIDENYPDVDDFHILIFLWTWYMQWLDRRGDWCNVDCERLGS
jgi:hypothetical protein